MDSIAKHYKFLTSAATLAKINTFLDFLGKLILYLLPVPLLWHLSTTFGLLAYRGILIAYPIAFAAACRVLSLLLTLFAIWLVVPLLFLAGTVLAPFGVPASVHAKQKAAIFGNNVKLWIASRKAAKENQVRDQDIVHEPKMVNGTSKQTNGITEQVNGHGTFEEANGTSKQLNGTLDEKSFQVGN